MQIIPIKTRKFLPPQDDLYALLDEFCPELSDGDLLFITSKVLSIHQGRTILIDDVKDKDELIIKEAERYIPRSECPGSYVIMTIKDGSLMPTAGIDASNSNGYYVLWPENSSLAAKEIHGYLCQKFRLKRLGVIITDSHSVPLRYGVVGKSTGFHGLNPIKDYRGKTDIFGREIKVSTVNVIDSLAATAVFGMGEGDEMTPLLILRDVEGVEFSIQDHTGEYFVDPDQDIYSPLYRNMK